MEALGGWVWASSWRVRPHGHFQGILAQGDLQHLAGGAAGHQGIGAALGGDGHVHQDFIAVLHGLQLVQDVVPGLGEGDGAVFVGVGGQQVGGALLHVVVAAALGEQVGDHAPGVLPGGSAFSSLLARVEAAKT